MDRMKKPVILFLTFISFQATAAYRPLSIKETPKIRVRVAKDLKKVSLIGSDIERTLVLDNERKLYKGKKRISFNCHSYLSSKVFNKKSLKLASLSTNKGLIALNDNNYIGKLDVVTSENKDHCDVINEVDMELCRLISSGSKSSGASQQLEDSFCDPPESNHEHRSEWSSRG